jgi:CHAT domain-containing protein
MIDLWGERLTRFAALVESGEKAEAVGRSLGATLLDPALSQLGPEVTRLVIVPDGPLHRMPWDALRLADGRFAVERWAISVAPSAAVITSLWRRARKGWPVVRPVRLLAFGDPALAGEGGDADASKGALPRLEESAREARLVARYAPQAELRLRERATAAYLERTPLQPFRVLHFATHALVDEGSVARTGLVLAPGEGESGFVGAGELGALRLDADLVVLSACSSAGGVVVQGEGVQGLTAPLLQAGARSVVATRWRIGDRSTVTFVQAFYTALAHGQPVSEALRLAKLDAIGRGAPASEWAAFVTVGDPLVTIPLRMPPLFTVQRAAALVGLVLVLAAVFVLRIFRRSLRPTGVR